MTLTPLTLHDPRHQRAVGHVALRTKRQSNGRTGLHRFRQEGSYKAVFPRSTDHSMTAVLVNTAGGVTGGDRFGVSVEAVPMTRISVTTQAAERIYRATGGQAGLIRTTLTVRPKAQLCWLPQKTILFDGSHLRRRLDVELGEEARFLMVEPLVFGREASGECLHSCDVSDRISITSEGAPLYLDQLCLNGNVAEMLQRPAIAGGARAMASIVLVDAKALGYLSEIRSLLPETAGASLINDRTLVVRVLAGDSYLLRKVLMPILTLLTQHALPKNWRL